MVESLELRAEGAMAQRDAGGAGSLESGAFAFLLSLWSFRPVRETIKKPNEWACPEKVDR